jgi:hypothetical protein
MSVHVKYPGCAVQLTGEDGYAWAIVGRVRTALVAHLRATGWSAADADAESKGFVAEATSGDYDNVLQTCMRWVDVR